VVGYKIHSERYVWRDMEIFSWILAGIGLAGAYITGERNRWGWALGLLYQLLWIVYAYYTQQYSFIVVCVVYGVVYIKNFKEWGEPEETPEPQEQ
jgi:nicotinamide riboside transporter PnuC